MANNFITDVTEGITLKKRLQSLITAISEFKL
jgi:hypothetical protein